MKVSDRAAVLAVVVIGIGIGLMPQLFAVCQDAEFAQVAGLRVRAYNLLIGVMAAVTVTVSMRTVGLLLGFLWLHRQPCKGGSKVSSRRLKVRRSPARSCRSRTVQLP